VFHNTTPDLYKTKTKTDFLVSDRSFPMTDGLRPHHWFRVSWFQQLGSTNNTETIQYYRTKTRIQDYI